MNTIDSPLIAFYRGREPDDRRRYLRDVQRQSLEDLETVHDYIQWMFPLPERSSANPGAPILALRDIEEFRGSEELRHALLESFSVMLGFYGLEMKEVDRILRVRSTAAFSARREVWLRRYNHNFLRISRILRCLALLGCRLQALALFEFLRELYRQEPEIIGGDTFSYWSNAIQVGAPADVGG
jgi:Opioid growth factor receptor (OGFr) conserved region